MTRRCQISGVGPLAGNKVSHSKRASRRRFLPNLRYHSFWHPEQQRFIRLRVSNRGMRMIDKLGLKESLRRAAAKGLL